MSDPTLLARLPGVIAGLIHAEMPDLREAAAHPGRFDLDELRAFMARAPAVRVAALGIDQGTEAGGPVLWREIDLAAFVVTRPAPQLAAADAALAIVQRLLEFVPGRRWAETCLGQARAVAARNLYSGGARDSGVALWAVTWSQPVQLETPAPGEPLPSSIYAGLAPDIGPDHVDDYVLVSGDGA